MSAIDYPNKICPRDFKFALNDVQGPLVPSKEEIIDRA